MANTNTNPVDALLAGVKQFLAELSDDDLEALLAEVREPADPKDDDSTSSGDAKFARKLFGSN